MTRREPDALLNHHDEAAMKKTGACCTKKQSIRLYCMLFYSKAETVENQKC